MSPVLNLVGGFGDWKPDNAAGRMEVVWSAGQRALCCLCVKVTGRLSFQIVSGLLGFSWRLFPKHQATVPSFPSLAGVGGGDAGHGRDFVLPAGLWSIYADVRTQKGQLDKDCGTAFVWAVPVYSGGRCWAVGEDDESDAEDSDEEGQELGPPQARGECSLQLEPHVARRLGLVPFCGISSATFTSDCV